MLRYRRLSAVSCWASVGHFVAPNKRSNRFKHPETRENVHLGDIFRVTGRFLFPLETRICLNSRRKVRCCRTPNCPRHRDDELEPDYSIRCRKERLTTLRQECHNQVNPSQIMSNNQLYTDDAGNQHTSSTACQTANRNIAQNQLVALKTMHAAQVAANAQNERLSIEKQILLKDHPDIFKQRYPNEWDAHLKETDYHGDWKSANYNSQWKEENYDKWCTENPSIADDDLLSKWNELLKIEEQQVALYSELEKTEASFGNRFITIVGMGCPPVIPLLNSLTDHITVQQEQKRYYFNCAQRKQYIRANPHHKLVENNSIENRVKMLESKLHLVSRTSLNPGRFETWVKYLGFNTPCRALEISETIKFEKSLLST